MPLQTIVKESGTTTWSAASGTSAAPSKPTGTVAGDVLVAWVTVRSLAQVFTEPTGLWTRIATAADGANNNAVALFCKVAGGSEASTYTFNWLTSASNSGGIARFSHVNVTTFGDTAPSTAISSSGTAATAPGIFTVSPGAVLIYALSVNSAGVGLTPDASLTEEANIQTNAVSELCYGIQVVAGPSGSKTTTLASTKSTSIILWALRPGPDSTISIAPTIAWRDGLPSTVVPRSGGLTGTTQFWRDGLPATNGLVGASGVTTASATLSALASLITATAIAAAESGSSTASLTSGTGVGAAATAAATASLSALARVAAAGQCAATATLVEGVAVGSPLAMAASGTAQTGQGVGAASSASATALTQGTVAPPLVGAGLAASAAVSTAQAVATSALLSASAVLATTSPQAQSHGESVPVGGGIGIGSPSMGFTRQAGRYLDRQYPLPALRIRGSVDAEIPQLQGTGHATIGAGRKRGLVAAGARAKFAADDEREALWILGLLPLEEL